MRNGTKRRGFTLAEMTVAISVGAIILAMVAAGGMYARQASAVRAAKAAVTTIEAAITAFEAKRGALPDDLNGDGITSTDEIVKQLKAWKVLPDSFVPLDPWGHQYVIVLKREYDTNPSTMCDFNLFPLNDSGEGFQVYSFGPDGKSTTIVTDGSVKDNIANFDV